MATSGARTTPAGMPVLRFQVQHTSEQQEAGKTRPVEVEAELVAYGKVAQELAKAKPGEQTQVHRLHRPQRDTQSAA
jgi:primosomal replication protein N